MNLLVAIAALFKAWSNILATAIVGFVDRLKSPAVKNLTERDEGTFVLDAGDGGRLLTYTNGRFLPDDATQLLKGSRVEIRLNPSRFLFRTLEFPAQAGDILEGIVRAQIDRLTPWTPANAVFGFTAPRPLDGDRIATDVAATVRSPVVALADAALMLQPASVTFSTEVETTRERVALYTQKPQGALNATLLSAALRVTTAALVAAAVLTSIVAAVMTDRYNSQRDDVLAQTARQQRAMLAYRDTPERVALQALERRKYDVVPATLVLDTLSQALPDHTYATELHVIGNRLQVAGISADAPSLIRLLELKPLFTRATFYAPTTRSSSDPGERFSIEALLEPKMMGAAR